MCTTILFIHGAGHLPNPTSSYKNKQTQEVTYMNKVEYVYENRGIQKEAAIWATTERSVNKIRNKYKLEYIRVMYCKK